MKKLISFLLSFLLLIIPVTAVAAPPDVSAPSAVLMERETGKVLSEKNAHEKLPPASVTKVMDAHPDHGVTGKRND